MTHRDRASGLSLVLVWLALSLSAGVALYGLLQGLGWLYLFGGGG